MTSTLNPACPLCGLRYEGRPLLELHIREDHLRQTGRRGSGGTGAPAPAEGSPSRIHDPVSGPSCTTKEVTARTATRHPRSGQLMTVLRKVIRTLRDLHDELVRASQAMLRPPGAPRPRPRVQGPRSGLPVPGHVTEHADRVA
jgi:hypothetical protein